MSTLGIVVAVVIALFILGALVLILARQRTPYADSIHTEDGKKRTHIVILGGGFGGVSTAQHLEKLLGSNDDFRVSLVSKENYQVYQPMLAEVISGAVGITDTVTPLRHVLPRTAIHIREIEGIDLKNQTVTLSPGVVPRQTVLHYDHLVFGLGNVTDFRGLRGLPEHAMPFKNLADALNLRNHLIHVLEEASIERNNPTLRKQLLTFVVAGGGFSGVEVVAELNDFVREVSKNYQGIDPNEIRVVLLQGGERILPEVHESLGLFAQKLLANRGVEIKLKTRLDAATSEAAILKGGEVIPTRTLISTIPSSPHPLIDALGDTNKGAAVGVPKNKGKIEADGSLQVKGATTLWALGDCSQVPAAEGGFCPPTAQFSIRQGKTLAHNIVASIRGGEKQIFKFKALGMLGALGHQSAVAEILGIKISGFIAWILWRGIYLMKLPNWSRRIKVASSWFLDTLLPPDLVQLKMGSAAGIAQEHFEPGQEVFHQDDVGDRIYIILAGEAEVLGMRDGKEVTLARLQSGEYFGEMALLNQTKRSATVRCVKALDVLSLPKREFGLLTKNLPDLKASFEMVAKRRFKEDTEQGVLPEPPSSRSQAGSTTQA
jgi:NADH dehydrogenase